MNPNLIFQHFRLDAGAQEM